MPAAFKGETLPDTIKIGYQIFWMKPYIPPQCGVTDAKGLDIWQIYVKRKSDEVNEEGSTLMTILWGGVN